MQTFPTVHRSFYSNQWFLRYGPIFQHWDIIGTFFWLTVLNFCYLLYLTFVYLTFVTSFTNPLLTFCLYLFCHSALCHAKHKFKKNHAKIIQKAIIFQSPTQQAYLITLEILYYEKDWETVLFIISLLKSLTQTIVNPQKWTSILKA